MEFVKKSSAVTEVLIPEGDVIRITDKATGNVLWEKKRDLAPNARWISRKLLDYWDLSSLTSDSKISCINLDTYRYGNNQSPSIRIGYINSSNYSITFTSYGTLTKTGDYWKHDTTAAMYAGYYPTQYTTPARALAISDDGLMTFFYSSGSYAIADTRNNRDNDNAKYFVRVSSPKTESEVRIIHSTKRKEYLVTGGGYVAFTIPETLSAKTTQSKYSSVKIGRACWCSRNDLYYGALTDKAGYIASSPDGYTWTERQIFSSGSVLGIADLTASERLCAVAAGKIALSSDGQTWIIREAPFNSAAGYAYSPEHDLFCVADNTGKIYLTKNFRYWQELEAPANVRFKDFFHFADGIFIGAAYQGDRFYILATATAIR